MSGLTADEQRVADRLVAVWDAFLVLRDPVDYEEELAFRAAIHRAQEVLMRRLIRRLYPGYWL